MIKNFSLSLSKITGSIDPFLFQKEDYDIHCVTIMDYRLTIKFSGWNIKAQKKYIVVHEDCFCLIHGKAFIGSGCSEPITSQVLLERFLREGSFVFRQLSGNFSIILLYEQYLYVVAPKTPGASVYYFQNNVGDFYLTNNIRSLPSNQLRLISSYINEADQFYDPGNTCFSGVKLLTAGNYLRITSNAESTEQAIQIPYWWPSSVFSTMNADDICLRLKEALSNAITKVHSKEVVSFISGGIDSSTVTYLAAMKNITVRTFSIGTHEFNEFEKAEVLANYIQSNHENIIVSDSELLAVYAEVVGAVGHSYSTYIEYLVPGYLAMMKVVNSGETVISGYGSDVLFAGFAKNETSTPKIADLINIEYTTTLWSNEASYNLVNIEGVDVVYPFFDQEVVDVALSIPPSLKYKDGWEKWILRKAIEAWLPPEIVWRRKVGIHETTGMETYLSKYLSKHCPFCIEHLGMRKTKDKFTLYILESLVIERLQPADINFDSLCSRLEGK